MALYQIHEPKQNKSWSYITDCNISWQAKGILTTMLQFAKDYEYSANELLTLTSDGIRCTQASIKELEEHGYLTRGYIKDNGKIVDWVYNIYLTPQRFDV